MPGEKVIDNKEVKANKEPDMKMKSQYAKKIFTAGGKVGKKGTLLCRTRTRH